MHREPAVCSWPGRPPNLTKTMVSGGGGRQTLQKQWFSVRSSVGGPQNVTKTMVFRIGPRQTITKHMFLNQTITKRYENHSPQTPRRVNTSQCTLDIPSHARGLSEELAHPNARWIYQATQGGEADRTPPRANILNFDPES